MKRQVALCWQEVTWHRPFTLADVHDLLTHLAATSPRGPVIWEIRGSNNGVRFLIGTDRAYSQKVRYVFRAHGNIQFTDVATDGRKDVAVAKRVKISRPQLSLKTDTTLSVIRSGLYAMSRHSGETVLQVVLGPTSMPVPAPSSLPDPHASWLSKIVWGTGTASSESLRAVREKTAQHGFHAVIRIGVSGSKSEYQAKAQTDDLVGALRVLETVGVHISVEAEKPENLNAVHLPFRFPLRLSVKELANFMLLPIGETTLPGVASLHPRLLLPPAWYKNPQPSQDRSFATGLGTAGETHLSVSPQDSVEHTIILGPTGSGKSTAMLNIIMRDIEAGRSVLLIDPKADLVNDVLARIPERRDADLVVIDPSDPCPVGFNPFNLKNYHDPTLIADAVLAVFRQVFSDNWGVRSQDVLSAALLTLAQTEGASLTWLPALLLDEGFRRRVTSPIRDRIGLEPFWTAFEGMKDSERRQEILPVLNKIRQYLLRPGLRNILGQSHPKFDLSDLFTKPRIVLVPLNKGLIGAESARLLGSLIVCLTWTLALSRARESAERRRLVSVYIDELQDYLSLPTDLSDALSQARGMGVGLTMCHQYRNQLTPGIRAAIDANARNKVVFGLNAGDARDMAAMAPELVSEDLMSLPRYHVYASLQSGGQNIGWVSGKIFPPPPVTRSAVDLRAKSMAAYGKPVEDIEDEQLALLGYSESRYGSGDKDVDKAGVNAGSDADVGIGRRKRP